VCFATGARLPEVPIKALLRGDSIDLSILAELYPGPG
jgi:hypothetical protein